MGGTGQERCQENKKEPDRIKTAFAISNSTIRRPVKKLAVTFARPPIFTPGMDYITPLHIAGRTLVRAGQKRVVPRYGSLGVFDRDRRADWWLSPGLG